MAGRGEAGRRTNLPFREPFESSLAA